MKAMFGFLTPQGRDSADPLQNAKTAAAWLRQLPSLDVIGRQQHVIRALDSMRKTQRDIDLNRVGAIEFIDAALGSDRRQLIKQYIETAEASPKLAERIWQALWEMSQAFMLAYQAALEGAVAQADNARWRSALAVAVRSPGPLPRHRRQAARVQVRALDPGEVDRAASDLSAGVRDAVRPAGHGAPGRGLRGTALVRRAGIPVRAAGASAQHGQPFPH